jgi:hypothetical protein
LSCEDFRRLLEGLDFSGCSWAVLQTRGKSAGSDGSAQSPSEPARLTLILGERDEEKLEIVLGLDLYIHNAWPFLGLRRSLGGMQR